MVPECRTHVFNIPKKHVVSNFDLCFAYITLMYVSRHKVTVSLIDRRASWTKHARPNVKHTHLIVHVKFICFNYFQLLQLIFIEKSGKSVENPLNFRCKCNCWEALVVSGTVQSRKEWFIYPELRSIIPHPRLWLMKRGGGKSWWWFALFLMKFVAGHGSIHGSGWFGIFRPFKLEGVVVGWAYEKTKL